MVKYNNVYSQIKAAVQKYCEKEKWRWKERTGGFGENLDDFWPRL